jgi:glutathione S-transferase
MSPPLARNPFGRVPVLEHDGFLLYETQAIICNVSSEKQSTGRCRQDAAVGGHRRNG